MAAGYRREQRVRSGDHAVGCLGHRQLEIGQVEAHHRPAHDVAAGVGFGATSQRDEFADWRADQRFEILRFSDITGDRHDARNHRLAMIDGAVHGISGGDVEALHADIGGR